ncbi:MAG: hypothetical protein KA444_04635 [Bacteroidia bacterium]|nr:hypothetical protein [Bacteroidia bacterium]
MKKVIAIILLVCLVLISMYFSKERSEKSYTPILNKENLASSLFYISAGKDTVLEGSSGTRIRIEKNTFIDSKGQLVQGAVKLELKEAIACADIALANLLTTSNGELLQTDGMIFLNATQQNEPLSIAESKNIQLAVPTEKRVDDMQIFSAEINSQNEEINWVQPQNIVQPTQDTVTTSKIAITPAKKRVTNEVEVSTDMQISLTPPIKPQQVNPGTDTIINLVFDTASFPELADYRNVKFKLRSNKNFHVDDSKIIWHSIDLEKTNEDGIYLISFYAFDEEKEISRQYKVSTVFAEGEDFQLASKIYNKKFEEFERKKRNLEQLRIDEEKQRAIAAKQEEDLYNQQLLMAAEQARQEQVEQLRQIERSGDLVSISNSLQYYVFGVDQLGWSNIDRFYKDERAKNIQLLTVIPNEKSFDFVSVNIMLPDLKVYLPVHRRMDNASPFLSNTSRNFPLPIGESAVVIATAYKDGNPYISIEKVRLAETLTISCDLRITTMDKMKEEMQRKI